MHVGDHDPGLEEQGQVHDDVLVAGGGALDRLPDHLLVDLGVGDPVQLLTLLLVLRKREKCKFLFLPPLPQVFFFFNLFLRMSLMSYHMFPHVSQVKLPGHFKTTLRTREVMTRTHLKDDRPERGSVQLPVIVEHTLTKLGSENFKDHDPNF